MILPRIDRLLTLYLFYPLRRILPSARQGHISILMYHSISSCDESGVHPYFRTGTSPEVFAEQMRFLRKNGYSVIGLDKISDFLTTDEQAPKKDVVITFDDGYRDFHTNAFPVLDKYGFTATMFLPTSFIGDDRLKFNGMECLTWSEVRELHTHGINFGSHTVTHPKLKLLTPTEVEDEIARSKETIEDKLGTPATSFSYPFAFPEEDKPLIDNLRRILKKCGYRNGVTTMIGTTSQMNAKYFMKRLPVNSSDDINLFKAKLEGGYDWLNKPQYFTKLLKRGRA